MKTNGKEEVFEEDLVGKYGTLCLDGVGVGVEGG